MPRRHALCSPPLSVSAYVARIASGWWSAIHRAPCALPASSSATAKKIRSPVGRNPERASDVGVHALRIESLFALSLLMIASLIALLLLTMEILFALSLLMTEVLLALSVLTIVLMPVVRSS